MQKSQIPAKVPIVWASDESSGFIRAIPTVSQIGIQNGAASWPDGFPPLCFSPVGAGGIPPFGQDFNALGNFLSAINQWINAGGIWSYDVSFSTSIGGYPQGAILANSNVNGFLWLNGIDNNIANPDAGGANWAMGSSFALFYNYRSISTTIVNTALTQAQLGGQYEFNNLTTQQTCTLPPGPNLPIGGCVDLTRTIAGQTLVVSTTDSSQIDAGGVSLVNSIIVAGGEEAELWWNGTNWVATGTFLFGSIFGPNSYVQIIPRTTFYVSPTGSDSNPGTSALPFLTGQGAVNYISGYASASQVTVNFAAGTYAGFIINPSQIANWSLVGAGYATTTITGASLSVNTGRGLRVFGATVTVQGFTFTAYYDCLIAHSGAEITLGGVYNAFIGTQSVSAAISSDTGASINVRSYNTTSLISGTFGPIFNINGASFAAGYHDAVNSYTATFNFGATTCSVVVACGQQVGGGGVQFTVGYVDWTGATPTGQSYYCGPAGVIQAAGGGTSFIPGTVAGVAAASTTITTATGYNGGAYLP